jgi:putative phosphoribosyl transferase
MLQQITIPTGTTTLNARVLLPEQPSGAVVWVHGAYPTHDSEVESAVAHRLAERGLATVNVELAFGIDGEGHHDDAMRRHAMHVIAQRLMVTTSWLRSFRVTATLPIGYFGVGVGGGAACVAAAAHPADVACVVTWQGRLDFVGHDLLAVLRAPTLALVRDDDAALLVSTRAACTHLRCEHCIKLVEPANPNGSPAATEQIASYAQVWFEQFLGADFPPFARAARAPSSVRA